MRYTEANLTTCRSRLSIRPPRVRTLRASRSSRKLKSAATSVQSLKNCLFPGMVVLRYFALFTITTQLMADITTNTQIASQPSSVSELRMMSTYPPLNQLVRVSSLAKPSSFEPLSGPCLRTATLINPADRAVLEISSSSISRANPVPPLASSPNESAAVDAGNGALSVAVLWPSTYSTMADPLAATAR